MDHLTVKELAELQGCSEQNIQKKCKEGKIICNIEYNERNRPKYIIPVSSLPEDMQKKYYAARLRETGASFPIKTELKPTKKPVKTPFEQFSEEERRTITLWCSILNEWQTGRDVYPGQRSTYDENFIGKCRIEYPELDISLDILYRKFAAYRVDDLDGVLGKRGGSNKGQSSIPTQAWDQFVFLYLNDTKPTVSRCYDLTMACMREYYPQLMVDMPCEKTFRRHIKTQLPEAVVMYLRDGNKAMHDKCMPYMQRQYDQLEVNEVWIADNHKIDIQTIDPMTGRPHRIYVTTFMDAKTGVTVGWNVTDNPNSQSTLIALRHAILRFGMPKYIYVDNGREFLTLDIGGRGHRKHRRQSDEAEFEPLTILQRLGIQMINAIPTNAQAKPVERSYCTFTAQFSRMWDNGYCGGTIFQKPESLARKIKEKRLALDYEVREAVAKYYDYDYNLQEYGGVERRFKGMSRLEVWNSEIKKTVQRVIDPNDLNLMLMRTTRPQLVKRNGVCLDFGGEKIWFMDPASTFLHLNKKVYVRYDPADLSSVRVYDTEDRYLFTWGCADKLLVDFIAQTREEIADGMKIEAAVKRHIIATAKQTLNGSGTTETISLLEAMALKQAQNEKGFHIDSGGRIIIVRPDEKEYPSGFEAASGGYDNGIDIGQYLDNINNN